MDKNFLEKYMLISYRYTSLSTLQPISAKAKYNFKLHVFKEAPIGLHFKNDRMHRNMKV